MIRALTCNSLTLIELSRTFGISAAGLLPVVDSLEEMGFLVRGDDPNDRRRSPLVVTEAAKDVLALVPTVDAQDSVVQALEQLGGEKAQQLIELMRAVVSEVSGDPAGVANIAARIAALKEGGSR